MLLDLALAGLLDLRFEQVLRVDFFTNVEVIVGKDIQILINVSELLQVMHIVFIWLEDTTISF